METRHFSGSQCKETDSSDSSSSRDDMRHRAIKRRYDNTR